MQEIKNIMSPSDYDVIVVFPIPTLFLIIQKNLLIKTMFAILKSLGTIFGTADKLIMFFHSSSECTERNLETRRHPFAFT